MTRTSALAHIAHGADGIHTAVFASYVLKSAFQPIFAFGGGKLSIAAFEGLIRPFRENEPVPPGQFFRAVPAQDRFTVETLTRTLHLLNAGACLTESASIFVNFDPSQFCDPALAETALRDMRLVLHQAGIDPARIVCEMTEHVSTSEKTLFAFVEALRAHGFRIAVDDYGADHSDMRRIEQLKPDIVKFDAHWITHLMESGAGFALLKTMVATFNERGIKTVFEGIEEDWQLELAEESGASMVQGYVLARPQLAPTEFGIFATPEPEISVGAALATQHLPQIVPSHDRADALPRLAVAPVLSQPGRPGKSRVFGRRQAAR